MELFAAAEKISAARALEIGLVDRLAGEPIVEALHEFSNDRNRMGQTTAFELQKSLPPDPEH